MKKVLFGILIVSLSLLLIIGCGQSGGGGTPVNNNTNANANTNTSSLYVVWSSCSPSSGEANVNANSSVVIKFNNALTTEGLSENSLIEGSGHTAGDPIGTAVLTLSENNTKLTISGITGWASAETEPNPPFTVNFVTDGTIQDIYGNRLATGETLVNFSLVEEFWRYLPNIVGTQKNFNAIIQGAEGTEGWLTTSNNNNNYYKTNVIFTFNGNGNTIANPIYFRSNSSLIRGIPFYFNIETDPPLTPDDIIPNGGLILLNSPIGIGNTTTEVFNVGGDFFTAETTVLAKENLDIPLQSNLPCQKIQIETTIGPGVIFYYWLAYNKGIVKHELFGNNKYMYTKEATSYTRP